MMRMTQNFYKYNNGDIVETYKPEDCLSCIYRDTAARRHDDPFTSAESISFCTFDTKKEFIVFTRYDIIDHKEIRDTRCPLL